MTSDKNGSGLAIVPARGGSKRLPKKNIQLLNDKPLVSFTIEAALKSQCFETVLLSSNDENILSVGRKYSGVDVEKRPERLSGDRVTVLELVKEISERPEMSKRYNFIALLLPTCPFRQASDIQAGLDRLTPDVDSVVSLTQYEFPPQLSVTLTEEAKLIKPVFNPCPLITGNTRSQDQKTIYRPNGGFYISWWKSFGVNQNFWKGNVRGYVMPRINSVDIDDNTDLMYAQFLLDTGSLVLN
jgi:CMP-N-acetylneuraminic acid synthetase